MATKRMFSKTITNSSRFLMMPLSAQALYFHLGMNADDDGFVEHFSIMRMVEAKPDDLRVLQAKGFVKVFDDEVLIILDWKENNIIRKDRYTPSKYLQIYKEELKTLSQGKPTVNQMATNGKPDDNQVGDKRLPQYSIDKDRLDKSSIDKDSIDNNVCSNSNSLNSNNYSTNSKDSNIIAPSDKIASEPPVLILPTNGKKKEYEVLKKDVDEWVKDFPAVDVMQELRKMRAWLDANPNKRKTIQGVKRFIVNWLSKTQDKTYHIPKTRSEQRTENNRKAIEEFIAGG